MFASIARAARLIFEPGFAGIALRSALLTLLLFLIGLAGAEILIARLPVLGNPHGQPRPGIAGAGAVRLPAGCFGRAGGGAVRHLFPRPGGRADRGAGLFRRRRALPSRFGPALKAGLRLAGMVLGADLLLLPLDIGLPGLANFLSLLANGWLLGWEYFELAALRHLPRAGGGSSCANPMAGRSGAAAS